jgi:hypothetical protein
MSTRITKKYRISTRFLSASRKLFRWQQMCALQRAFVKPKTQIAGQFALRCAGH